MKYKKLEIVNFKPYYENERTINLFNEKRKEKNITLNIGPNMHGKTSISEMIMWCLFGEAYYTDWGVLVNRLAKDVAKHKKADIVQMKVLLTVEMDEEDYTIIRTGELNLLNNKKVKKSELEITKDGVVIREDPNDFISKKFVLVDLMEYFIFDADDLLTKFKESQQNTIKKCIYKILKVEILDRMIDIFKEIGSQYLNDISKIRKKIKGGISDNITELEKDIRKKKEAIDELEKENKRIKKKQKKLFEKEPPGSVKYFSDLLDKRKDLEGNIEELNKEFLSTEYNNKEIYNFIHLLFLNDIIKERLAIISDKKISREEFQLNFDLIKTTMGDKYKGIVFEKPIDDNLKLIKKSTIIKKESLDSLEKIIFPESDTLNLRLELDTLRDNDSILLKISNKISKYFENFQELSEELSKTRNEIRKIGLTEEKEELKRKYDDYNALERDIDENRKIIREINEKKFQMDSELRIQIQKEGLNIKQKQEKEIVEQKIDYNKKLMKITEKTKLDFLSELLKEVNSRASEFFRGVIKKEEARQFHSINITSDYNLEIIDSDSVNVTETANRSTVQIALMSFFIALSEHIAQNIPYVIDQPIMRLDPGNDKRLLMQLGKGKKQIIMHLLPGREYTTYSFSWLKEFINVQNWIYRIDNEAFDRRLSYVEEMNPDKIIEFDINEF